MQVSVETTSKLERRMTVQVPAQRIDGEVQARLRQVGKTARLKGFRPGKIPPKVLQKRYGGQVRHEVLSEVMQTSFSEAIQQEKLQPAGGPKIEPSKVEPGQDLEYVATFEVYPEIALSAVEGLKIEQPQAKVTDKDLARMVENLREQRVEWEPVERAGKQGDQVTIDFKGTLDGGPFEGGTAEDHKFELGSGQMLADFDAGVEGMTAGETRVIEVAFPQDYGPESLAGKTAQFEIVAKEVAERRLPELNPAFFAAFGVDDGGEEAFLREIRENMERELKTTVERETRQNLLNALVEANPLDLPQALIDQEADYLREDSMRRMGVQDRDRMPPREPFLEQAGKRVALGLLIGEIATSKDLRVDHAEVDARLDEMVAGHDNAQALRNMYHGNAQMMNQIEMGLLEQKVVDWLLQHAKIKAKKTDFAKLMDWK